MLTVTVNDRPLDVAAIVEHGRVLMPMRATFSALGASVAYDPRGRVIIARSSAHALRLTLGSNDAIVDGKAVTMDVAPRVVAARAYVPLRFVAQSMGAVVGFDARANLVSVVSNAAQIRGAGLHGANVVALAPTPNTVVDTAYPTISASLGTAAASRAGITLTVDGADVTALASFDGSTITYMPRIGLSRGTHTVAFSGRTLGGDPFSAQWSFNTSTQAPPDAPAFSTYDYRFYVNGPAMYYPGDWMHFTLIAPPGGSAELQLCNLGYQYALWNSGPGTVYEANFPAPYGYWMPSCTVTAVYTAWNGQRYWVPLPIIIGLYTAPQPGVPTPHPSAHPVPLPTSPRRVAPTPAPLPVPTAHPIPRPTGPRRIPSTPLPRPSP